MKEGIGPRAMDSKFALIWLLMKRRHLFPTPPFLDMLPCAPMPCHMRFSCTSSMKHDASPHHGHCSDHHHNELCMAPSSRLF